MLDFFLIKVSVGVSVHHSVLCAGLQMLWCTDMSARLFVCLCLCLCVCVCVFLGVCVLSELYVTSSINTPPKCSTCLWTERLRVTNSLKVCEMLQSQYATTRLNLTPNKGLTVLYTTQLCYCANITCLCRFQKKLSVIRWPACFCILCLTVPECIDETGESHLFDWDQVLLALFLAQC